MILFRHIFCKFGDCSNSLITDQVTHFNNHLIRALHPLLGYNDILMASYYSQSNKVMERINGFQSVEAPTETSQYVGLNISMQSSSPTISLNTNSQDSRLFNYSLIVHLSSLLIVNPALL